MFSNCLHTTGHYNSATDTWDCTACGKVWAKKPYCARCGCEEGQTCNAPYKCPCHEPTKLEETCVHGDLPQTCKRYDCWWKRTVNRVKTRLDQEMKAEEPGSNGHVFAEGKEYCKYCRLNVCAWDTCQCCPPSPSFTGGEKPDLEKVVLTHQVAALRHALDRQSAILAAFGNGIEKANLQDWSSVKDREKAHAILRDVLLPLINVTSS